MYWHTQVTLKQLDFVDDLDLRQVLLERLEELDRVFVANANYSTLFLAIGAIEGLFKHLANLYKSEIQAMTPPDYPITSKGKKKRFEKLTIEELYRLLSNPGGDTVCLARSHRLGLIFA